MDFKVTHASNSEVKEAEKLLEGMKEKYPEKIQKCRYFLADRDFKFETHTIRGLEKMEIFLTVTLVLSLTLAKAKIETGTKEGLARLYA